MLAALRDYQPTIPPRATIFVSMLTIRGCASSFVGLHLNSARRRLLWRGSSGRADVKCAQPGLRFVGSTR